MDVRPATIDARSRTESVRLRDLRDVIPAECFQIDALRSWFTLFRILATIAAFTTAIHFTPLTPDLNLLWQAPLLGLLWLFDGWAMVGLFVLGHDCGHRAFSKRTWVNKLVGHICMSPLSNALHTWTVTHDHHHAHTQRRGEEVDWASHLKTQEELDQLTWSSDFIVKLGYALPFGIFFWIITNTVRRGFLVERQIGTRRFEMERTSLRTSNLIMLATILCIYGSLFYFGGLWTMLKHYGIPGFIATVTGALIITVQHANRHTLSYTQEGWTPLRGQLVSTFDVRFPRLLETMWCNITIHIPHHVAPTIPWYHLRKASRAIQTAYPDYYQSQPFSTWHLSWFANTPVLREVPDKGFFVMDLPDNADVLAHAS
jgi:omega-6 fatty acid desaturase (delta-12 desaturase)